MTLRRFNAANYNNNNNNNNNNTARFIPPPEKKGRNLRQIEEQFRALDEKEKKLRDKFDVNNGEEVADRKNNNTMETSFYNNNSSILSTTCSGIADHDDDQLNIDNTFIMSFEKRAKRTNSHHNPFRSAPPKPPKLLVVPTNTTTQFRSSHHFKQTARKRSSEATNTTPISGSSSTNTTPRMDKSHLLGTSGEDSINVQDRTTIFEDQDESSNSGDDDEETVVEEPVFSLSSSGMDPKVTEIFSFEVRVHQLADHANGLFDVKFYDENKPFERVFVLKDLRINRDCYIIFHEPSFIKFNALTLPWVEKPEHLVNHTIVVEVQGMYPTKTKIAKSTIKFSLKQSPRQFDPPINSRAKRSNTPPTPIESKNSLSPSRLSPTKILKLDNLHFNSNHPLPFTTSPSNHHEDDLQRSLSCVPMTSVSLKIQTPTVPPIVVEEDPIQRNKLERSNSIDSQLSPSSQKYIQLQALRENMKLNLMLQQKLLN